ncbi:hypothetical protein MARA_00620 (plasmid) [Mycolicibacterium arabiense]|uniref:LacI family transcriptional regulator n=1 Tax=Mycolicibacterium arabiense TaxID=1286181 RepID=A0A7I7RPW6_9MYCO|nr:LacI family DNA-binding transcriptional regulator [Mycolicibacterium arabiense]MCV7372038.1 LacI family DNA-binding transcriptional regulator [Mycolicibacterium arabiense]BBY46632.1 hypothetical protein MARA_00620 [Mycolicibacterium arabiense]
MNRPVGRPSREAEFNRVVERSGASAESVRNFFNRPGRLSTELRRSIARAVAETGYRPIRRGRGSLDKVAIGYQMPRSWSMQSPVMDVQFHELLDAAQSADAHLVPFVVDPRVPGVDDVVGGTDEERAERESGLQGWHRDYAHTLAPWTYQEVMRERLVRMFVVNDLSVDDPRLEMLAAQGVPYVALGLPRRSTSGEPAPRHPYVETDNHSAIAEMVRRLREAGCRTFGHVGFSDDTSHVTRDRREAVADAVGGEVPRTTISYLDSFTPSSERHRSQLRDWLRREDVDAVICDSDALAYMVHLAAPSAGRSTVQDPRAVHDDGQRSVMLTGNDNSHHRTWLPPAQRWITMAPPEREKMEATIDLLAKLHAGLHGEVEPVLIPPRIVPWGDGSTGPAYPSTAGPDRGETV